MSEQIELMWLKITVTFNGFPKEVRPTALDVAVKLNELIVAHNAHIQSCSGEPLVKTPEPKEAKTTGADWLGYSLASFNGSGYADRNSPLAFCRSYREYNRMKNRPYAIELVNEHWETAKEIAVSLLEGPGPVRLPSAKRMDKFLQYYTYEA